MTGVQTRGHRVLKRTEAARWLSQHPTLLEGVRPDLPYRIGEGHHAGVNPQWRAIAYAIRDAGFFSQSTGVIDMPIGWIVAEALRLRDRWRQTSAAEQGEEGS